MRKQQQSVRNPRIGYHLTSWENWQKILVDGAIVPYRHLRHEQELVACGFRPPVLGIWIWTDELDTPSEYASVLWHICTKRTQKVVVLKIKWYNDEKLILDDGRWLALSHHIDMEGSVEFHENARATILAHPLSMDRIELVREYDFSKYVRLKYDATGANQLQTKWAAGVERAQMSEVLPAGGGGLEMSEMSRR